MSLIGRFVIALILILTALLTIGYIKLSLTAKAIETNRLVNHTYSVITELKTLTRTFQNIRIAERGYLLTGDRIYLQEIGVSTYSFDQHLIKLTILSREHTTQETRLKDLDKTFDRLITDAVQPLLRYRDEMQHDFDLLLESDKLPGLMEVSETITNELELIIDAIENEEYELLAIRTQEMEFWYALDRIITLLGPIFIILVMFLAGSGALRKLERYRRQQESDQQDLREARDRFASVIAGSNLGTWEWDLSTGTMEINATYATLLGYQLDELVPMNFEKFKDLIFAEDLDRSLEQLTKHYEGELEYFNSDFRMHHKDGHQVWILSRGKVLRFDENHKPLVMTGTHADITKRVANEQALARSEEENRKLFEAMNQGFAYCQILTDENEVPNDFRILRANENFELQTGLAASTSVGKCITELIDVVEPYWFENNGKVALSGQSMTYEAYSTGLGRLFRISAFSPEHGYFAMIIDDISQQRQTEQQLAYEKTLLETTLLSVGDGVISTDAKGMVQFLNKAAEELTGWLSDEAKGQSFEEVFRILCGKDRKVCSNPVAEVLKEGKRIELAEDTILIARDGFERYINDSAAPIFDHTHAITGVVLVFRDSTEQRKKQHEIISLSFTDSLTKLNNRRYYDQIKSEVDKDPYYPLTLVVADVNGLKLTNDAFGHEAGDDLLRKVADVLKKTCREDDIISRIGGDEFVLLLPQTDALHAQAIVKRINNALQKEEIRGIQVSVSFGYAVKEEEEPLFEDTFKVAEDVMYQNKLSSSTIFKKHVINSLLERLFGRDSTSEKHSELVSSYCVAFARELGYPADEVEEMRLAGLYHDLGKIAIEPSILLKSAEQLTKSEALELRRHAEIGYNILRSVGEYASFAEAVLYHHERYDGNGYPQGLKREEIPQQAQILAIANTYADLIGPSFELHQFSPEEAKEFLQKKANILFSPELVELFITKVLDKTES